MTFWKKRETHSSILKKPEHENLETTLLPEQKAAPDTDQSEGMCIGMCLGMTIGQLLFQNPGTGLCIGMCVGMCIGSGIKKET